MEVATTIRVNGKDYCKMVDPEKVEKAKLMRLIWANEALELGKKHQSKPIEILK